MSKKDNKLYCECGAVVGEVVFSHIDPLMRGFGSDGRVYKHVYNDNVARNKNGMLIPQRYNRYSCKKCWEGK